MNEPRPYSVEEARYFFLEHIAALTKFWATIPTDINNPMPMEERLSGLAYSFITLLDGNSGLMPAYNVAVCTHPEDAQFSFIENKNYYNNGTILNDDTTMRYEFLDMLKKYNLK